MKREDKKLRKGFTTGTCAAAGAKAAAQALFAGLKKGTGKTRRYAGARRVEVTLPRGGVISIPIKKIEISGAKASATVVKDAGDDPDVTNGADIVTEVELKGLSSSDTRVEIRGGAGVGVVTRRGLKVPPGHSAINPVPRSMIRRSVREAAAAAGLTPSVTVTVTVPQGALLAAKTLNGRLGIIGGISILGTTGIVEPMSLSAYRHSISYAVNVAIAAGCAEVVYSTGRSSEKVAERTLKLQPVAFVLTGDHMGFALKDARKRQGLKRVVVAGQFGKFTKLAAGHFETHCSDSSVELSVVTQICKRLRVKKDIIGKIEGANTAREAYFIIKTAGLERVLRAVCKKVRDNSRGFFNDKNTGVRAMLVGYNNDVACAC